MKAELFFFHFSKILTDTASRCPSAIAELNVNNMTMTSSLQKLHKRQYKYKTNTKEHKNNIKLENMQSYWQANPRWQRPQIAQRRKGLQYPGHRH